MPATATSRALASPRVLLVDDNAAGLKARQMVLEELGYCTVGTSCPKKALGLFGEEPFDLVITDYKMPEMSGLELIIALRAQSPELPIILLSGYVEPLGLSERSTGANIVIMKCANEVNHLIRATNRLLSAKLPRKPASVAPGRARKKNVSSS